MAPTPRSGSHAVLGAVLVGAGLASLTHGFGLVDMPDAVLAHALVHGIGLMALAVGLLSLIPRRETVVPGAPVAGVTA